MTGVEVGLAVAWRRVEVAGRAAQEVLPEVLEQMPGEAHVDPGVAAAIEARQQHGDDEGHGCGNTRRIINNLVPD